MIISLKKPRSSDFITEFILVGALVSLRFWAFKMLNFLKCFLIGSSLSVVAHLVGSTHTLDQIAQSGKEAITFCVKSPTSRPNTHLQNIIKTSTSSVLKHGLFGVIGVIVENFK